MHWIKKNIPNLFTLLNLCCGLSILFAIAINGIEEFNLGGVNSTFKSWLFLIILAALFDFLDGTSARLLNVESKIGKQLDSLADMVTFGIAPAFLLISIISDLSIKVSGYEDRALMLILVIIIPVFSAIRLARFNTEDNQENYFKGLPTPALALFIVGIGYILSTTDLNNILNELESLFVIRNQEKIYRVLILISLILPILLVSNIRLFSLKISKNEKIFSSKNIYRLTFIASSLILFFLFSFGAFSFIIPLYLILSITNNILE